MAEAIEHHGNGSGHEHREANVKLIVYSSVGLAVSVAIVCLIVWGFFNFLKVTTPEPPRPTTMPAATSAPPYPHLEVRPDVELQDMRGREEQILHTYGWVDQKNGRVHIPIDQAMDAIVGQLPVHAQANVKPAPVSGNPAPPEPPRGRSQYSNVPRMPKQ